MLLLCAGQLFAGNLLTNPGFESGNTDGWFGNDNSKIEAVTSQKYSGNYSCYCTGRTKTWQGPAQNLIGKIQSGKTYMFTVRVKLANSDQNTVNLAIKQIDSSGTTWPNINIYTTAYNDQWSWLTGVYTPVFNGTPTELFLYVEGPAGVNFYIDDANVVELTGDWLGEANARIEQIRKRDVSLSLKSLDGKPLKGVNVRIKQTKHQFAFGSCLNYWWKDNQNYTNFFKKHFEWATIENALKWHEMEPTRGAIDYSRPDALITWCAQNGISVRGHCIFYPQYDPNWVKSLSYATYPASSDMLTALATRINGLVNHYKGQLAHWDVCNEMIQGTFYRNKLGDGIYPWMFEQVHQIDPNSKLFVNQNSVVSDGVNLSTYKRQITNLLNGGAVIHGIGVQGHMGEVYPQLLKARLDEMASLGLPIWVTEYDSVTPDEKIRADRLEKFFRTAFSHSSVEGIIMWGFHADSHWLGANAAIVNSNWTLNEAGRRYESLLHEWTTDFNTTTDCNGKIDFRGFHGSYEITFEPQGKCPQKKNISLTAGENAASFELLFDGITDFNDLQTLAANWLWSGSGGLCNYADINNNGRVDFEDFGILAARR